MWLWQQLDLENTAASRVRTTTNQEVYSLTVLFRLDHCHTNTIRLSCTMIVLIDAYRIKRDD